MQFTVTIPRGYPLYAFVPEWVIILVLTLVSAYVIMLVKYGNVRVN